MRVMLKNRSNTVAKVRKAIGKKKMPKGVPFKKNDKETGEKDERINRKGRPRTADALKEMVLDVLDEEVENTTTHQKTRILRAMIAKMALGAAPADHTEILNRGFGKVPEGIAFTYGDLMKIIDHLPSDMIDRIAQGESINDVLIAFITSRGDGEKK